MSAPCHRGSRRRWRRPHAGEQGQPVAKLYLGVMYAEGRGVRQDYVRAHMWFSLAVAQGEQRAVKTLAMTERRMTAGHINEAQSSHAIGSLPRSHLLVSELLLLG